MCKCVTHQEFYFIFQEMNKIGKKAKKKMENDDFGWFREHGKCPWASFGNFSCYANSVSTAVTTDLHRC